MRNPYAVAAMFLALSGGLLWGGYVAGKHAADQWYWSHAKKFVGYGYVGIAPNDGYIYCSDVTASGSFREGWSEQGNICHENPSERIDSKR